MITMAAKQLVIIVFVFACSVASEEENPEENLQRMNNTLGKKLPPGVELLSLEEDPDDVSSNPLDSTTTTDAIPPITTTPTNEYTTNEAEPLNKADGGSEGVPDPQINKMKRETDEKENINNPIVNTTSTPVTTSTEKSQKDKKEENYESTTKLVLGSSRAPSNNEEMTSRRDSNNENKKEQESVKNTSSANKNSRNSNSAKNNKKDHTNNRHNSENDVIDSMNTKSDLDKNEDEDSAQPKEYQIMSSKEPRRRKFSSRGKAQGRQADKNSCESQEEYNDGQKTTSQGAEPKHLSKKVPSEGTQGIQGEESKILPQVVINVTTVLPSNKPSTATSSVPTTVTTNRTQSTLKPSNNSTTSLPPTNAKSKKWKKALDIFGKVIGVITVIGGAFYLVYSVM